MPVEPKDILNPNWIGILIGLIGIIVGVILAFSFRSRPRLATQINTLQLVGHNSVLPDEIEFLFKGERVPKVTMSRVAVWNVGNTTIRGDQIVASDPLRIVTSEGSDILEASILKRTRDVTDFTLSVRPDAKKNEVELKVDFLDPSDGALVQIIHTGDDKVMVTGTLRGVPKSILVIGVTKNEKGQEVVNTSTFGNKMIAVVPLLFGLLFLVGSLVKAPPDPQMLKPFLITGVLLVLISPIIFWATSRWPPPEIGTQITSSVSSQSIWFRILSKSRKK